MRGKLIELKGLPCPPSHGDLHNPGTEAASPGAPALQDSLLLSHRGSIYIYMYVCMYVCMYIYVCMSVYYGPSSMLGAKD